MSRLPSAWANPLDDPLAVTVAGLLLVLLVRLTPLTLPLALALAVLSALGLAKEDNKMMTSKNAKNKAIGIKQ